MGSSRAKVSILGKKKGKNQNCVTANRRTAKGNESCTKWVRYVEWMLVMVVQYYCTNMCLHFVVDFVAC